MDEGVELEQRGERGAVRGGDELDGVGGEPALLRQGSGGRGGRFSQRASNKLHERNVRMKRFFPAAQDAGVAALQAEDSAVDGDRSEEHTSELQSRQYLVCRLLLEKKR